MNISHRCTKIKQKICHNTDKKEKNKINIILNSFSSFYVREESKSFSFKVSFFIKKIFNLKTGLNFLLDEKQYDRLNSLSSFFNGDEEVEVKNFKLINSDFVSMKRESLYSFFLSLNTSIKNEHYANVKNLIQNYLYKNAKTKGDFIAILSISLDVINNYNKEKVKPSNGHGLEYDSKLDNIKANYKKYIDKALDSVFKEIDRKKHDKLDNAIIYLVNTMHDIYSMEMEKRFIINIAKCFMDKVAKFNLDNCNDESFKESILNLLINKLENNEGVKEFVDNMLGSGVLEYEDIIKEKEKTAEDECFISDYNRKIKNIFSENINSDEMKNNIAKFIRDNYQFILSQMKNKSNYLENERVLLDIVDCLKSDNDWSLNLL